MKTKINKLSNQLISKSAHLLIIMLISSSLFAQSPQKMSYQAVIRNTSNALVTNTPVGMRISVLQGSNTGTVVYTETQTPTTSASGLVSIEIGGGVGFDTIKWYAGPYFIKTETDPTGGTTYSITGASQLLSVPYALNAKAAEEYVGPSIEVNNYGSGNRFAYIDFHGDDTYADFALRLIRNNNGPNANSGLLHRGKGDLTILAQDAGSVSIATKSIQRLLVDSTGNINMKNNQVINVKTPVNANDAATKAYVDAQGSTLTIGQAYLDGIIFWLDESGQHGLIAATSDQSSGIKWTEGINTNTNANRQGIGGGVINTERIIANKGAGTYAAQTCANYGTGPNGFGDWYLPGSIELYRLYVQRAVVGGFSTTGYYWTSDEYSNSEAWCMYFGSSNINAQQAKNTLNHVRAIRRF